MSESYARKLRQFMQERAQERLQSQRRVAQLEEVLGTYGAGRKPMNFGSPGANTNAAAVARDAAIEAARSAAFGTPPPRTSVGEAGSGGGDYTRRLAQLAAERAHEEERHREQLARLRATQQGLSLELPQVASEAGLAGAMALGQPTSLGAAVGRAAGPAYEAAYAAAARVSPQPAAAHELGGHGEHNGYHSMPAERGARAAEEGGARASGGLGNERVREQQRLRLAELQRHIGVLQAGGVTSQLGRMRLARLQVRHAGEGLCASCLPPLG